MKVYYNGFNVYHQFLKNTPIVEQFTEENDQNLRNIEVRYSFSVLLVADSLLFRKDEKPSLEIFNTKIDQFDCTDDKIIVLEPNGNLCKISIDNLTETSSIPLQIHGNDRICKISCGSKLCVALTIEGKLFNIPNKLEFESLNIVDVVTGREHCLLLDNNGNVYSFGQGSRGQLGHGFLCNEVEPKLVEALGGIDIRRISAGGWHSCAISADGDLYTWGWNGNNQLGLENVSVMASPHVVDIDMGLTVKDVSCGNRHTIVLLDNGQLWGCGWNKYRQLFDKEIEIVTKLSYLHDFSNEQVLRLKCGPWNSLVFCE